MAKQIEDIVLRLKNEGFENLDKIKGSFRELNKVTGFTETEIARLRKEVLDFDKGVGKSTQTLRGQTDALKALQSQAVINSTLYKQLGNDLKSLGGAYKEAATGAKAFTDAQLTSQFVGAKPATFEPQIAALKKGLRDLSVYSRQYTEALTEIQRRQIPFNAALGRQSVIAGFEAFQQGGKSSGQDLPALPDTTAALQQRLTELSAELVNVSRGGSDWVRVSREIVQIQREMARTIPTPELQAVRERFQASRATNSSSGFRAFSYRASQVTARADAEAQAALERTQTMYARPLERPLPPTELFRSVANIQSQQVTNQLLGRSYTDVAASIRQVSASSDGSLNSLRAQRTAWESLRNTLGDNKVALREVDKELNQLDRRIEKRSLGRGKLSGMQLAQGVGAALSGGIFGGPEGLIGGLGGLALGGVGGAFAGAAAGAQVGMFRQQLGAVTDYSARIDKLQIALRGIVGSQAAYSQALAAAASVTRDLNIPQETAIQGMTRLSAAVQGAGGTVSDSAFAFRAVSEAVKATGGNAEQADGALLALTQVFSKGKVSAEELNQIAERLPGTFTLFAKAAGMTGPELQKALQQGQVGLNDLMKFLQLISTNYGQTAMKIAASSQEAGARLSVAMKNMQLEVGRALQPVGALLQNAFTEFIRSTTPALVLSAKLIGGGITNMYNAFASGIKTLITLRGVFENLAKTMLVFGGITAGVFVASNITTFTNALKGALVVLRTMLSVEKAMLVVENARIAAQAILVSITSGAGKGKLIGAGVGALAGIGAVVGIGKLVESVVGDIEKGLSGALKGVDLKIPELTKFSTPSVEADKEAKKAAKDREKAEEEALRKQTSINRLLQEQLRLNFEAGAIDADALGKLEAEESLLKQIIRLKINEVMLTSKTKDERELGIINLSSEFTKESKRISKQRADILEEIKGLGADIKKEWRGLTDTFIQESPVQAGIRRFEEARAVFVENRDKEMKQLREKAGLRPEGAAKLAELGGAKAAAAAITPRQVRSVVSKQILQDDITSLQNDIRSLESGANTMGTLGEIMQRHSAYWKELDEGQRQYIANLAEIKDSLRFMQDARIGTGLKEGAQAYVQSIGTMREATSQLAQTGIKGVEDAIFSLVTTGTANFREFAASILRDTSRMIIQQLILRSVMQIIGAIGGGGGGVAANPLANFNAASAQYMPNAMGNAFAANGIVPFAMGGLVDKPTLFKFADGGAGRLGLMGEAGPEAIMPLRRLPSGRLGVEAAGGSNSAPITVNVSVDANGTSVQGDAGQGEQLGRVISQAVQAELIKQQRPGGLLSR